MYIDTIINNSPENILQQIAERIKEKRLALNHTQKSFAKRAGVGYDAYRKFENSGEITLRNLVLCAIVLDEVEGFSELFTQKKWRSIDELLKSENIKKRKRGSRNE
jgi:transcriptional regulator with XRE-family HTH domain